MFIKCVICRINSCHGNANQSEKGKSGLAYNEIKPLESHKKLTSVWRYLIGEQVFNTKIENLQSSANTSDSVIGKLLFRTFFFVSFFNL